MIYLYNEPYPQEISVPRSFGVIVPTRREYLSTEDIAANLTTDSDKKILAASQGVALKEMVDAKADASDVYTKTEVDTALSQYAKSADVASTYETKSDASAMDTRLQGAIAGKADKSDTYTKAQVDSALGGKQDTISDLSAIRSGAAAGATAVQPAELSAGLATKQDTINDLATIRSGAAAGATAVQPAALTAGLATKQDTLESGVNIKTINNESLLGDGNIDIQGGGSDPDAVKYTPQTLTDAQKAQARTNIGAGTYSKPSGGIPSTDLASAVQTSLGKADSALQSFTETDPVFSASAAAGITASDITAWDGKYTKPAGGIPASDLASGVIPVVESLTTAEIDTIWANAS